VLGNRIECSRSATRAEGEAPRNGEGMDIADREPSLLLDEQAVICAVDKAHH
jgi:hypothetical protein